jgi:predicted ATPase
MKELYVISGGPCAGKTTLVNHLKKLGFFTVNEAARIAIERGLVNKDDFINKNKRRELQNLILKIQLELENGIPDNTIAFLDRSAIDGIAYFWSVDLEPSKDYIEICKSRNYKAIFILEQIENYVVDDIRYETYEEGREIHKLIIKAYECFGYTPYFIPSMSVEERANLVLNIVRKVSKLL